MPTTRTIIFVLAYIIIVFIKTSKSNYLDNTARRTNSKIRPQNYELLYDATSKHGLAVKARLASKPSKAYQAGVIIFDIKQKQKKMHALYKEMQEEPNRSARLMLYEKIQSLALDIEKSTKYAMEAEHENRGGYKGFLNDGLRMGKRKQQRVVNVKNDTGRLKKVAEKTAEKTALREKMKKIKHHDTAPAIKKPQSNSTTTDGFELDYDNLLEF